jgi:hypothetical protein
MKCILSEILQFINFESTKFIFNKMEWYLSFIYLIFTVLLDVYGVVPANLKIKTTMSNTIFIL